MNKAFTYHKKISSSAKPKRPSTIPVIELPDFAELNLEENRITREESIIELQNLDDLQSITSDESEATNVQEEKLSPAQLEKSPKKEETSLSVVIESNNKDSDVVKKSNSDCEKQTHSGIVLSPLQLGQ